MGDGKRKVWPMWVVETWSGRDHPAHAPSSWDLRGHMDREEWELIVDWLEEEERAREDAAYSRVALLEDHIQA